MTKDFTINSMPLSPIPDDPIYAAFYYKEALSNSYLFVANNIQINPDGTVPDGPTITIDTNTVYDIQAVNQICPANVYTETISFPCAGLCPPGYSLDPTGSFCQSIQTALATAPTNPQNAVSVTDTSYNTCGSFIFSSFNLNGTGTATQIPLSNFFWVNGAGACVPASGNLTDGRINKIAVWISAAMGGQTVGYSQCFDLEESTTLYFGFAADNFGTLQIDGANVIVQDPVAMDAQFGTTSGQSAFQAYCIYPVVLSAGEHVVGMIGTNGEGSGGNPGMIACEIYDNTSAEISAATSTGDLDILFSTSSVVGQPIQIGNDGNGYSCPDGYTLNSCTSPYLCQRTVTTPIIC